MKPLGGMVGRALRALGLERGVAGAGAVLAWHDAASVVLGGDAMRTEAIRLDGDTLVVAVPTPQWANELRLRERDLLAELERRSPEHGIRRIRAVPSAKPR